MTEPLGENEDDRPEWAKAVDRDLASRMDEVEAASAELAVKRRLGLSKPRSARSYFTELRRRA